MEIRHIDQGSKGTFVAEEGEIRAGEMTYVWAGTDKFIIDHTEVSDAFGGQGVGKNLVLAAVEFAREKNVRILPLCPFAKKTFERSPELADVLT
jgi:uncharacterized protein